MPKLPQELPHATVENSRLLIPKLPEFRRECGSLDQLFQSLPRDKLDALQIGEWFWAPIYELTFLEHVSWLIHVLGQTQFIQAAAQSDDFNRVILQDFEAAMDAKVDPATISWTPHL